MQLRQLAAVLGARLGRGLEVAGGQLLGQPLQAGPERSEADDHQPRPRLAREHERERRQQQLDALGGDQLADEHDQPIAGLDAVEGGDGLGDVAVERGGGWGGVGRRVARGRRGGRAGRERRRRSRGGLLHDIRHLRRQARSERV